MSAYESGTVASLTISGETVRGVVSLDGNWIVFGHSFFKGIAQNNDHYITDVRPLVVLDLDDSAQVDSLCKALVEAMHAAGDRYSAANGVHPATVRAALKSLTKPPRIPEPGLWGVVEASDESTRNGRREWVRYPVGWRDKYDYALRWDSLIDPTLIRKGVQS